MKLGVMAAAVGVVVAVAALMPEERLNQVKTAWSRAIGDPGTACLDYERRRLHDPDSARLLEVVSQTDNEIVIKYKAKNAYGAYITGDEVCAVSSGKFDESNTPYMQSARATNALMDQIIKCFEDTKAYVAQGHSRDEARAKFGKCN
jgi:hypothetical protein